MFYTVCLKKYFCHGLHCLPKEVLSGIHCLSKGIILSGSALFVQRNNFIKSTVFVCLSKGVVLLGSTLFASLKYSSTMRRCANHKNHNSG